MGNRDQSNEFGMSVIIVNMDRHLAEEKLYHATLESYSLLLKTGLECSSDCQERIEQQLSLTIHSCQLHFYGPKDQRKTPYSIDLGIQLKCRGGRTVTSCWK